MVEAVTSPTAHLPPRSAVVAKPSFKAQMLKAREAAIVQSVNRLLAEKGFDAMTVDEVAADVGIAKASLYKHFASKEGLAAAAMTSALHDSLAYANATAASMAPLDKLQAMVRHTLELNLRGEMPSLPSQNSALRQALVNHPPYIDALMSLSDVLGEWIEAAQASGSLNTTLPATAVLYTLFARACDPVLKFLHATGLYSDEQVIAMVLSSCFDGLKSR
jgi:TetR/AcrR family transcriptional regulator, regulator of autoinduction and epiphytic fitness